MDGLLHTAVQIATILTPFALIAMTFFVTRNARRVEEKITVLEHQTNSIKDALVASTAKASHAEGLAEGLVEGAAQERRENPA